MDALIEALLVDYGVVGALVVVTVYLLWPNIKGIRAGDSYVKLADKVHALEVKMAILFERTK